MQTLHPINWFWSVIWIPADLPDPLDSGRRQMSLWASVRKGVQHLKNLTNETCGATHCDEPLGKRKQLTVALSADLSVHQLKNKMFILIKKTLKLILYIYRTYTWQILNSARKWICLMLSFPELLPSRKRQQICDCLTHTSTKVLMSLND